MLTETTRNASTGTPEELANKMREFKKSGEPIIVRVRVARTNHETAKPELIADYKGVRIIIPYHEIDNNFEYRSVVHFVGRDIKVVVKRFNAKNNIAEASRAEVQRRIREDVEGRLTNGEVIKAKVVSLFPYGGYVSINGVTGFIKNINFSDDATRMIDVLEVGDSVKVKLLSKSESGTLRLELAEKYKRPNAIDLDVIEVNQFILGVVRSIKPWGVFVNIARGIDALACSDLENEELEENQLVQIKVLKVYEEGGKKRIRAVIKKIIR